MPTMRKNEKNEKKITFFAFYSSKIWKIARIIVPLHRSFENERSFGVRYVMKHIEPCFILFRPFSALDVFASVFLRTICRDNMRLANNMRFHFVVVQRRRHTSL